MKGRARTTAATNREECRARMACGATLVRQRIAALWLAGRVCASRRRSSFKVKFTAPEGAGVSAHPRILKSFLTAFSGLHIVSRSGAATGMPQ
jgi:hypothetical protein